MDIETRRKISRTMKGKSNFEGKKHTHATKIEIGFSQEGHRNAKDHKWVTNKETGEERRVKGNVPKGMRKGRTQAFSQWIHAKENFQDGRNPENKGDMARHGLKNKTMVQLKKVRSSDTASPRQKQLAHWYINMHKENTVTESLRKWFKQKWVRMDTKGNIKGDCAKEPGEGKPKCLPLAKAQAMDKKDRAAAVRRKRREDPNPDRQGAPINVRTEACWAGYIARGMKKKGNRMVPNCVPEEIKNIAEAARIARKAGQPANSKQHSDLYTDENPKGTITGLKFATTEDAKASVDKIKSSGRSHAHKIQAAIAMEQRARVMGKASAAAIYRSFINDMKEKTKEMKEDIIQINEKSTPTNPTLWSQAKSLARSKFDVYPSAYANGWAAKWYKSKGGGWKSVSESLLENYNVWNNDEPVQYAKHLQKFFGNPDEFTDHRVVWYDKDGFKRIEIIDEYILHASPIPHYDFCYCYVDLKVPHELAKPLADSSESIMIDFLKNEVGARCASLSANAVTLNYCLDVVENRVKPSKQEYERRIKEMKSMFSRGEKYELDWWPDISKDTDPKNKYYMSENYHNDPEHRLQGTKSLVKIYKKDTPGQTVKENNLLNRIQKILKENKTCPKCHNQKSSDAFMIIKGIANNQPVCKECQDDIADNN